MNCRSCAAALPSNARSIQRYCGESCKYRARANREGRSAHAPLADRFWAKVEKTDSCWLWTGAKISTGYGEIHVDQSMKLAHRVSWEMASGPIPRNMTIDHLCRVRSCVNPEHMEIVTAAENTRRGQRDAVAARTHCFKGHPWTPENTLQSNGRRRCRTCRREAQVTRDTASKWPEWTL